MMDLNDEDGTLSLPDLSRKFITRVKLRNRITLVPHDPAKWFAGALSTLQLRFTGSRLSDNQRAEKQKIIVVFCHSRHEDFGSEIIDLFGRIMAGTSLSFGHAQKLGSIFLKYAFVVYHAGEDCPFAPLVEAHGGEFPVPIDREVLKFLDPRPDYVRIKEWPKSGGSIVKIEQSDGTFVPWTKLSDKDTYLRLQTEVSKLACEARVSPIEYEMRKLWIA